MEFETIEECNLPSPNNAERVLLDETMLLFREEYLSKVIKRDLEHLQRTKNDQNKFRTFIPYSTSGFNIAKQIVWFYDELFMYDPIYRILTQEYNNLEQQKHELIEAINVLYKFRDSIENSYISLICENHNYINLNFETSGFKKILSNVDNKRILSNSATYRSGEFKYDGFKWILHEICVGNRESLEITGLNISGNSRIPITLFAKKARSFDTISKNEFISKRGDFPNNDISNLLNSLAEDELKWLFKSLGFANLTGTSLFLTGQVHETVLKRYIRPKTSGVYSNIDLILPFVKEIPSDRLMDVRNEIPEIFLSFRSRIKELTEEFSNTQNLSVEDIRNSINEKLRKEYFDLENEMKATLIKSKILGYGIPVITGLGSLFLYQLGTDLSKIISPVIGSSGLLGELKVIADYWSERIKKKSNPLYYLWRARN